VSSAARSAARRICSTSWPADCSRCPGSAAEFLGDERGVVQDHAEQVVEIVGDPAGELAQNLQALALVQLGLQTLPVGSIVGAFLAHPEVEPVLGLLDLNPLLGAFGTHPQLEPVLRLLHLDLLLGAFLAHPDLEPVLGLLDLDRLLGAFVVHDDLEPVLRVGNLHTLMRVFGVDVQPERRSCTSWSWWPASSTGRPSGPATSWPSASSRTFCGPPT